MVAGTKWKKNREKRRPTRRASNGSSRRSTLATEREGKAVLGAEATMAALANDRLSSIFISLDCDWYQVKGYNPISEKMVCWRGV